MVSKSGLPTLPVQQAWSICSVRQIALCGGLHKDRASSSYKKALLDTLQIGIINMSMGTEFASKHVI